MRNLPRATGDNTQRMLLFRRRDVEHRVTLTLSWLPSVGLSHLEIQKLVSGFPRIFNSGLEKLQTAVQRLADLGMVEDQITKAIAKHSLMLMT
mmetsp:Transcript_27643/g.91853  ORF Transcript_27643/g.91853 Transcript_27643/m.91853 type:complete len:93 (-) Transcript_27643:147-425(-)